MEVLEVKNPITAYPAKTDFTRHIDPFSFHTFDSFVEWMSQQPMWLAEIADQKKLVNQCEEKGWEAYHRSAKGVVYLRPTGSENAFQLALHQLLQAEAGF